MQSTDTHTGDVEIPTEGAPELVVRGHSGDIVVNGSDRSSITVHIADSEGMKFHRKSDFEEEFIAVTQNGNQVTIDVTHSHETLRADLTIGVPFGSMVAVNTVNGDISVNDTRAPVELATVQGDVRVVNARDAVKITTVGGDVRCEHLVGALTLQTTNGDVVVRESSLDRFNIHTVNGDVSIETPLRTGEHYYAKTTNGDISIMVPGDTAATVQARTMHGDFHSSLRTDVINRSKRNWQGRINGGGANLELESMNGDITINELDAGAEFSRQPVREHAHSIPPIPSMSSHSPADDLAANDGPIDDGEQPEPENGGKLRVDDGMPSHDPAEMQARPDYTGSGSIDILARLERGEMTVEEAMSHLDALR